MPQSGRVIILSRSDTFKFLDASFKSSYHGVEFYPKETILKKFRVIALLILASTGVFAKTIQIDPTNLNPSAATRDYIETNAYYLYLSDQPFTVLFYLHPALQSDSALKSDPININCNGHEIMLAPGSSFACAVNPFKKRNVLNYRIPRDYARNGADLTTLLVE